MIYSADIVIPANTQMSNPLRYTLGMTSGIIKRIWIRWRFGVADLGSVRILHHDHQQWPRNPIQWFPSSKDPLEFADNFPLDTDPFDITIEAYNLDDMFEHRVWVAFEVERVTMTERFKEFLSDVVGG